MGGDGCRSGRPNSHVHPQDITEGSCVRTVGIPKAYGDVEMSCPWKWLMPFASVTLFGLRHQRMIQMLKPIISLVRSFLLATI